MQNKQGSGKQPCHICKQPCNILLSSYTVVARVIVLCNWSVFVFTVNLLKLPRLINIITRMCMYRSTLISFRMISYLLEYPCRYSNFRSMQKITQGASNNQEPQVPSTIAESSKISVQMRTFANISILFKILATLPVTTCSSERSFSALNHIKSYL